MFLKQMTLGLTRRTPILWFQLTDWPRQAKDINIAWSLGVLQLGCFLAPNCFVSLPFGLIFAPLGASSLFPPFAAAVVRGDSQRHSWSNLKITFGSMLIIDCWIIFSLFFGFGDFLSVKWEEMKYFGKLLSERFEILISNICLPYKSLSSLTWNIW